MGHNPIQSNHFCEKEIVSTSNIAFTKNDGIFEMLKWENDAKIGNDADLIYKQGGTMAYIKKKSERKFKITVCNGYKVNGQKRMKAQTITVPSSVPKRGIQQYVMAEAERIEKKFKYAAQPAFGRQRESIREVSRRFTQHAVRHPVGGCGRGISYSQSRMAVL